MKITIQQSNDFNLAAIDTLVLAGGGNRCWWQAGVISALTSKGWPLPPNIIATSAGAAIATALLTTGTATALTACKQLYAENNQLFHWKALAQLRLKFAHQHIYPAWLTAFMGDDNFAELKRSKSKLTVAVTQPAQWLGLTGSLIAGSIAYLLDKKIAHSIHPNIPRYLGLHQAFFSLNDCQTAQEARVLLAASAAAAPFMKAQKIGKHWCLDGGYTDNAPIPAQTPAEADRTLVLLTRHYPNLPQHFSFKKRHYWQPSRTVPVSTWDCRQSTLVEPAFQLGIDDSLDQLINTV